VQLEACMVFSLLHFSQGNTAITNAPLTGSCENKGIGNDSPQTAQTTSIVFVICIWLLEIDWLIPRHDVFLHKIGIWECLFLHANKELVPYRKNNFQPDRKNDF